MLSETNKQTQVVMGNKFGKGASATRIKMEKEFLAVESGLAQLEQEWNLEQERARSRGEYQKFCVSVKFLVKLLAFASIYTYARDTLHCVLCFLFLHSFVDVLLECACVHRRNSNLIPESGKVR